MTGRGATRGESTGAPGGDQQIRVIHDAFGGVRGLLDSGLPTAAFVVVFLLAGLMPAVWSAVGIGAVLLGVRLARRESAQHAVAGFVVVGVAAFIASRTGQPESFFLPKLLINGGYGLAWLVSILIRWPILGVVLGPLLGEWFAWRRDPPRLRAYTLASWLWVGLFAARLVVAVPLYLSGQVVALGVAHLATSWPLFLLLCWATWLILRRVPVSGSPGAAGSTASAAPTGDSGSPSASPDGPEPSRPSRPGGGD